MFLLIEQLNRDVFECHVLFSFIRVVSAVFTNYFMVFQLHTTHVVKHLAHYTVPFSESNNFA